MDNAHDDPPGTRTLLWRQWFPQLDAEPFSIPRGATHYKLNRSVDGLALDFWGAATGGSVEDGVKTMAELLFEPAEAPQESDMDYAVRVLEQWTCRTGEGWKLRDLADEAAKRIKRQQDSIAAFADARANLRASITTAVENLRFEVNEGATPDQLEADALLAAVEAILGGDVSSGASMEAAQIFPPGECVREEMAERGWTRIQLAEAMGGDIEVNLLTLDLMIDAPTKGMHLDAETARGLERAFGVSAAFWMNLDAAWQAVQP